MNTMNPSAQDVGHMNSARDGSSQSGQGIRDLLRDTALLVTSLSTGGKAEDSAELRERCKQLIEDFSIAMEHRGFSQDIRNEALIAQCGLLDEVAMRHLPTEARSHWEFNPLQVETFNLHEAGERVFENLNVHLEEPYPPIALLECYSAILGMGFLGKYARDGEAKRRALMAYVNAKLEKLQPAVDRPFIVDQSRNRWSNWLYRLSPWTIALLASIVALVIWGVWSAALDAQLAHLLAIKAAHP
ncbi:DotU family type IV/VI secretion system protein [Herbaspirillum huttiense]|uniref:DotU family type IV/VI secretion system protein n=1 Tax=Herbaspirillum huttiense TaxID=863372 RepID=UPI000585C05E|nr:DotU family type IV/VI secretion system protein [Herbaspirillum huttiense]